MTTLEMRAAMAAREAAVWPEPEQRAVVVEPDDERVPSGARGVVKLAKTQGWTCELTYARGTSMVGKDCVPGPVIGSVLLRAQREGERVAALWLASPKATCAGCGKLKTPTPTGLIAKHKAPDNQVTADRDGTKDDCAGSGQPARLNPIGVSDYAFSVAYATEGPGWWSAHVPVKVSVTHVRECLRGSVATVVAALNAAKTQTPGS